MKRYFAALIITLILIITAGCTVYGADETSDIPTQTSGVNTAQTSEPQLEPRYTVDPYAPYDYDDMQADVQQLAAMYPQYIEVSSIGSSVEGRDLTLVKMGSGKTKILLVGAHHAREYITSTYLMNTIDKYLYAAAKGQSIGSYDVEEMLSKVSVYIVPMVNPDGVNLVINGLESASDPEAVSGMAMLKDTYAEWKANINGVDLNRQYPCFWDEKKQNTYEPSSEMFKGFSAASEPEVKAMMALCKNNEFALAASFHSKGEIVYWADSGTVDSIPFAEQTADAVCSVSGYEKQPVSQDPAVYGAGFENWFRQELGRPGLCIELTPGGGGSVPHDDAGFDELVWDKAQLITAVLMEQSINLP